MKPGNRPGSVLYFPFLAIVILLLHLLFEGLRWQMIPAYLLIIFLIIPSIQVLRNRGNGTLCRDRKWLRITGSVISIIVITITAVLSVVLPVFELPEPTGPYSIGTITFMLEDPNRMEGITDDPNDHRKLMIRAWYPADTIPDDAQRMRYMHPYEAEQFAAKYGLPGFMVSHLRHVKTHVYEDLSISNKEPAYPVLLFSHGYNVPPATYAGLLTEIASHGYIVMAVNHPYQSVATVYPDGSKVFFNHKYEARVYNGVWELIGELEQQFWVAESDSTRRNVIRQISAVYPNTDMIRLWAEDHSFVIDQFERIDLDNESRFSGRLDLKKIGAFGHSAGGAADGQLLLSDPRVKAAINWDGAQWGDVIDSTLVQPFLRIEAVRDSTTIAPNDLIYHNGSKTVMYDLKVNGFGHSNFSDIPLLIPVRYINQAGEVEPYRALELIADYSISFFDKHLRNEQGIEIKDLNQKYPELQLREQ